jgi:hypothetical protein
LEEVHRDVASDVLPCPDCDYTNSSVKGIQKHCKAHVALTLNKHTTIVSEGEREMEVEGEASPAREGERDMGAQGQAIPASDQREVEILNDSVCELACDLIVKAQHTILWNL